jgi:hypothetical protein
MAVDRAARTLPDASGTVRLFTAVALSRRQCIGLIRLTTALARTRPNFVRDNLDFRIAEWILPGAEVRDGPSRRPDRSVH